MTLEFYWTKWYNEILTDVLYDMRNYSGYNVNCNIEIDNMIIRGNNCRVSLINVCSANRSLFDKLFKSEMSKRKMYLPKHLRAEFDKVISPELIKDTCTGKLSTQIVISDVTLKDINLICSSYTNRPTEVLKIINTGSAETDCEFLQYSKLFGSADVVGPPDFFFESENKYLFIKMCIGVTVVAVAFFGIILGIITAKNMKNDNYIVKVIYDPVSSEKIFKKFKVFHEAKSSDYFGREKNIAFSLAENGFLRKSILI